VGGNAREPRNVRREPKFEEQCAAIDASTERMDDALRGVEWTAATNPEGLPTVGKAELRVTFVVIRDRAFRVLIEIIDDKTSSLRAIHEIDPAERLALLG
jgi:hypothetical protein